MDKQKLTYTKVNNSDNIICIDLHNGYSIVALFGFTPGTYDYTATLYLKNNSVENLRLISECDELKFKTGHQNIKSAILKKVSLLNDDGMFEKYIKWDKFENMCIDNMIDVIDMAKNIEETNKTYTGTSPYWDVKFTGTQN